MGTKTQKAAYSKIFTRFFIAAFILGSQYSFSATQGQLSSSSSGSFSITLTVPPVIETTFQHQSPKTSRFLTIDQPADFCISGRGINQFSLAMEQFQPDQQYQVLYKQGEEERAAITSENNYKFNTNGDCGEQSGELLLQAKGGSVNEQVPGTLSLVISVE